MTDREKVIKGFECCHVIVHDLGPDKSLCETCPYKDVQTEDQINLGGIECVAALHDDAIALLKELEPVEPALLVSKGPGDVCSQWYLCGKCKKPIDYKDRFCKRCGQAVKWE